MTRTSDGINRRKVADVPAGRRDLRGEGQGRPAPALVRKAREEQREQGRQAPHDKPAVDVDLRVCAVADLKLTCVDCITDPHRPPSRSDCSRALLLSPASTGELPPAATADFHMRSNNRTRPAAECSDCGRAARSRRSPVLCRAVCGMSTFSALSLWRRAAGLRGLSPLQRSRSRRETAPAACPDRRNGSVRSPSSRHRAMFMDGRYCELTSSRNSESRSARASSACRCSASLSGAGSVHPSGRRPTSARTIGSKA